MVLFPVKDADKALAQDAHDLLAMITENCRFWSMVALGRQHQQGSRTNSKFPALGSTPRHGRPVAVVWRAERPEA
jgi:hypothetical protein